ncbi:unnamed protein product [Amoebophrya sp. A120]|nr:unnamed protein product [Amoebophrya sp. A120]|eukprot:GSA120T00009596001.1
MPLPATQTTCSIYQSRTKKFLHPRSSASHHGRRAINYTYVPVSVCFPAKGVDIRKKSKCLLEKAEGKQNKKILPWRIRISLSIAFGITPVEESRIRATYVEKIDLLCP